MSSIVRIAMWSGPRNLSTALMRSFSARGDTAVIDEPFYAAYLAATGREHPMRDEVLAAQPHDPREVAAALLGPVPGGRPIYYQKHMTHHLLPAFDRSWLDSLTHAFLLRAPAEVLASYVETRAEVELPDIGIVEQRELFDRACDRLGCPPPTIDSRELLADPAGMLRALCGALGIDYTDAMLSWPAGRHPSDGVWAPAWYAAVERSTGFARPAPRPQRSAQLPAALARIADQAATHFEHMAAHRLRA